MSFYRSGYQFYLSGSTSAFYYIVLHSHVTCRFYHYHTWFCRVLIPSGSSIVLHRTVLYIFCIFSSFFSFARCTIVALHSLPSSIVTYLHLHLPFTYITSYRLFCTYLLYHCISHRFSAVLSIIASSDSSSTSLVPRSRYHVLVLYLVLVLVTRFHTIVRRVRSSIGRSWLSTLSSWFVEFHTVPSIARVRSIYTYVRSIYICHSSVDSVELSLDRWFWIVDLSSTLHRTFGFCRRWFDVGWRSRSFTTFTFTVFTVPSGVHSSFSGSGSLPYSSIVLLVPSSIWFTPFYITLLILRCIVHVLHVYQFFLLHVAPHTLPFLPSIYILPVDSIVP